MARCQSTGVVLDSGSRDAVKPISEMPSPPSWPLLGHLPLIMKHQLHMDQMFQSLREEYGDIYKLYVPGGIGTMVVLFRPEDIKKLYKSDGKTPHIQGFEFFEFVRRTTMKDRYTSVGLVSNGEEWYQVRTLVQQDMMRPKSALYYISDLEDIATELTNKIGNQKNVEGMLEPFDILQEYALEAVGSIFMGTRLGALQGTGDGKRLVDIAAEANKLTMTLLFTPLSIAPYLPIYKKFIKLQTEAFDICKKHVDNAIEELEETDDTVIAKMVRKCGKDSAIPTIMGIDALQAGIDTTGSTAAFLLYHLASNPEKQEKLYREICDIIGPEGKMTESALAKMKYLKACQTESQRILPAIFGTGRRAEEGLVIGGYQIPKGAGVVRCGSMSSNDPANFVNPKMFMPERWLRGCPEHHTADSFANIPFGHGARACIGQRFARLELFMMMVKILQRFKMEYTGEEVGTVTELISKPDKPINIKFTER